MNAMLDRLEDAAGRQRRFVADASHELQSPLASFRAQLEVSAAHSNDTDWRQTSAALLADSQRMERLVRDLLFLARSDEHASPLPRDLVDLDDVVLEEVRRLRPATGVGVRLVTENVSAAPVPGSRDHLVRLVRNLLENAVRHAVAEVRVELGVTDDVVRLVVSDDGPGVPADDRDRIFDRFIRLDEGRSRGAGGTGLGLAIAAEIARHHGGGVALADSPAGARFVVTLPAAAAVTPTSPQPTMA